MKTNLITTALLLSASAFIQAETKTELEPINVYSAYATPVNQDQTASSITVLTEKDFAERNATYVSDVLKTVPGVAMGISGGRGATTSLFLRGADSNQTAVIIDGIKVNPVNGYGFDFGGLSLSNIERIEVLRGEQSALWGSDAMGGVIDVVPSAVPVDNRVFGDVTLLGKSVNGTIGGSLMLGIKKNAWYSYIRYSEQHFGDYHIPTDSIVYLTQRIPIYGRKLKNTAGIERNIGLFTQYQRRAYRELCCE